MDFYIICKIIILWLIFKNKSEKSKYILCLSLAISLLFGIFGKIDLKSYRDAIVGFTIYLVFILILGTLFNHLAVVLDKSNFKVNYMFMFDPTVATSTIPLLKVLVNFNIKIGKANFYPF